MMASSLYILQRSAAFGVNNSQKLCGSCCIWKRFYRVRKRFYKTVSITQSDGKFEINLDKRKLKTPMGKIFTVPSEPLAIAIATEWESQRDIIRQHSMHLTSLSNTAQDNPTHRSRETIIRSISHFLDTDTLCYRLDEPPELVSLQQNEWDPLLDWFNKRYNTNVESTSTIIGPGIPSSTREIIKNHLSTHNDWALVGIESAVHSLKSLILTFAVLDRKIETERAMYLSRLEVEFQVARWGRVEWGHDIEVADLKARVSSAVLFAQLVSESSKTLSKVSL